MGWEFVHVAIDDASRLAYAEILQDDERPVRAASFGGLSLGLVSEGAVPSGFSATTAPATSPQASQRSARNWA
jgi:hypothetical protein